MFTALVLVVVQCSVALSTPELTCTVTNSATFHCNMAGFENRLSSLFALQIVKKSQDTNGQDAVIATVESGGVWLSRDILQRNEQRYNLSGELDPSRKRDAWLKLTLAEFTQTDFGIYACQIYYTDHPADTDHSMWSSDLLVNDTVLEGKEKPGFKIVQSRVVHLQHKSGRSDDGDSPGTVASLSISTREHALFASLDKENNSLGSFGFCLREKRSATESALEAHILNVTYEHQVDYVCSVNISLGKQLTSSPSFLPQNKCPEKTESLSVGQISPSSKTVNSTQSSSAFPFAVFPIVGVVVGVLFTVCVAGVIVYCFLRKCGCSHDAAVSLRKSSSFSETLKLIICRCSRRAKERTSSATPQNEAKKTASTDLEAKPGYGETEDEGEDEPKVEVLNNLINREKEVIADGKEQNVAATADVTGPCYIPDIACSPPSRDRKPDGRICVRSEMCYDENPLSKCRDLLESYSPMHDKHLSWRPYFGQSVPVQATDCSFAGSREV